MPNHSQNKAGVQPLLGKTKEIIKFGGGRLPNRKTTQKSFQPKYQIQILSPSSRGSSLRGFVRTAFPWNISRRSQLRLQARIILPCGGVNHLKIDWCGNPKIIFDVWYEVSYSKHENIFCVHLFDHESLWVNIKINQFLPVHIFWWNIYSVP